MADEVSTQIAHSFKFNPDEKLQLPAYSDTLYIDKDQYGKLTSDDLAKMESERYDAWAEGVLNPPIVLQPDPPTSIDAAQQALDAASNAIIDAQRALSQLRKG